MEICSDPYEVAQGSSALVLVTEWADINSLDLSDYGKPCEEMSFLDTRNLLDPVRMAQAGFRYFGIGR